MAESKIVQKFPKVLNVREDLQVLTRILDVDGVELLDIRQYVPSLDKYGSGIIIPAYLAEDLRDMLHETLYGEE